MEKRQTKLVDTVGFLFQTRVQFPPSPQYEKSLLYGEIFCIRCWGIDRRRYDCAEIELSVLGFLIDFIYPKKCVGCGAYDEDMCESCFRELSIADQICPVCGEDSLMGWTHLACKKRGGMEGLIVIYDYRDEKVKEAIDGIKFDFNRNLIKRLLRKFTFETGEKFDYLIPVPLHFYRENWRGFNQAKEIAMVVGKKMRVPVLDGLMRTRKTKQQSLILDKKQREKNVRGAFVVGDDEKKKLKCKKVLLVDDVFTSGADMRECTKVLKKAGVEVVWGLALAH